MHVVARQFAPWDSFASPTPFRVVAEGVERAHQVTLLRELGCDLAQGYYFSKPLSSDEVSSLMRAGS